MERQEFDLNEYSLEVKDGKAVVERKEVFKLGDVLSNEIGVVVIYAGTNSIGGIVTYSGYRTENGNFTDSKGSGWGYTKDFHYASEEQKAMLFAEIDRRGYVWDAKDMVLRKSFGDGDILVDRYGDIFICCVEGNTGYSHGSYVCWDKEYDELSVGFMKNMTVGVRLATDGERKFLSDRLAKEGLEWDAEKRKLRKKQWRAEMGEVYYAVCVSHAVYVLDYIEGGVSFDDRCFETGNYFRTKEQAEKTAEEIRKVFEKYKEEQK